MLLNSNNFAYPRTLYSIGHVIVDSSFHTQSGSEAFFSYFGNNVTYSIKRTVDEADFPRLEDCLAKAEAGTVQRTVIRMTGVNGLLRWVLASVKLIDETGEEPLYSIELSDVFSLDGISRSREKALSEYRYILSLTSDLAFEYSFETRHIRIYMFDCCREIVLADDELEHWQAEAVEHGWVLSRYIETFNTLCRDIKNGVSYYTESLHLDPVGTGNHVVDEGNISNQASAGNLLAYEQAERNVTAGLDDYMLIKAVSYLAVIHEAIKRIRSHEKNCHY